LRAEKSEMPCSGIVNLDPEYPLTARKMWRTTFHHGKNI
jgi:hypothetical protein